MSQLRFRSTPIIIGNFESCFKQRNESTVNAAISKLRHNMLLSSESPAKWAFAGFSEGVLTVAIDGEVTMPAVVACRGCATAAWRKGRGGSVLGAACAIAMMSALPLSAGATSRLRPTLRPRGSPRNGKR